MWYVTILYIVVFILIALCLSHASDSCGGPHLNAYALLVWTWIIALVLFALFGVFIADEVSQMLYMGSVVAISSLFIFFILLWAIVDAYGYSIQTHQELHELLCNLDETL